MLEARVQSVGISRRWINTSIIVLVLPVAVFLLLRHNPSLDLEFGSHAWHFGIVSVVAAIALLLALLVTIAAKHLPEPRTFFLAMAFIAMAGIFLAHGLGTAPFLGGHHGDEESAGEYGDSYGYGGGYGAPVDHSAHEANSPAQTTPPVNSGDHSGHATAAEGYGGPSTGDARLAVIGLSARLSLLISSILFALAVTNVGRRLTNLILQHWNLLAFSVMAAVVAYAVVALAFPMALIWVPVDSPPVSWTLGAIVWAALAFAGWRFLQAYRLSFLALQGTMALSMALLMEAQVFMILGPIWHLSWWEYHIVMLIGFLAPVAGLLWQYRSTGDLSAIVEGLFLREAVRGIRAGDPEALSALGAAVAAKDGETSAHVDRVSRIAVSVGERLGLAPAELEVLRWAGRLHDLGKIGVPNSILLKPSGLTEAEFRLMQLHSARGWQVARRAGVLALAAPAIRGHHERWNGSGYPDGLAAEAIPLGARIIAVADVWDALTAERPYRPAWSPAEAAAMIHRDSGVLLDARCVDALFAVLQPIEAEAARAAT